MSQSNTTSHHGIPTAGSRTPLVRRVPRGIVVAAAAAALGVAALGAMSPPDAAQVTALSPTVWAAPQAGGSQVVTVNAGGGVSWTTSHSLATVPTADVAVTTFAGAGGVAGTDNGRWATARFQEPTSLAADVNGYIYVTDAGSHEIRLITPHGDVYTVGGTGAPGCGDGYQTGGQLNAPRSIAASADGNFYIAESGGHRIRRFDGGSISAFVGACGESGTADGTGTNARFASPSAVAVDGAGIIYAVSESGVLNRITSQGVVTTLASGLVGTPTLGVAVTAAGDRVYVTTGHSIATWTMADGLTTFAGAAGSADFVDGTGAAARFSSPSGLALAADGTLYVADEDNHRVRRVSPAGVVTTLAGNGTAVEQDGSGTTAGFNRPAGLLLDSTGTKLYVADAGGHTIRVVTVGTAVTTLAGTARTQGFADGTGLAARFQHPNDVAVDLDGNVLVADWSNHRIRKITPEGVVTTFAGGRQGCADGLGTAAEMNSPRSVAVGADGTIYVAESYGHRIRTITPAGQVTTLAGGCGVAGTLDGVGAAARFTYPSGIDADLAGNAYVVAESGVLNKITPAGVVTTLATEVGGLSGVVVSPAGDEVFITTSGQIVRWTQNTGVTPFTERHFNAPFGLTRAPDGTFYVANSGSHQLIRVLTDGSYSWFAGDGNTTERDGTAQNASFYSPFGVALDAAGTLYVADVNGPTIRKVTAGALPPWITLSTTGGTGNGSVTLTAAANTGRGARSALVTIGGKSIAVTQVGLAEVPFPPRNVEAAPGNTQVTLTFNAPQSNGGAPISAFTVTVSPGGATFTGGSGMVVTGLTNGTPYTFTVTATNSAGTSEPSNPVTATPNLPPGAPQNVVATLGNRKASVAFDPPLSDGGSEIQYYTVTRSPGGSEVHKSTSPVLITGLTNGTEYTFTVTATNAIGRGPASTASAVVIPGVSTFAVDPDTWTAAAAGGSQAISVTSSLSGAPWITSPSITRARAQELMVSTLGGQPGGGGSSDGAATTATFSDPNDVAVDASGNILVADWSNHRIRKVTPNGVVTTLAGSGAAGCADGTGIAAELNGPRGIAIDPDGTIYVAESGSHRIRKITPEGVVSGLAGDCGVAGTANGQGTSATFTSPSAIDVDGEGNLYVASESGVLNKITPAGVVTTLASGLTGTPTIGLAVTPSGGTVYLTANHRIAMWTTAGGVTTLAGTAGTADFADGTGAAARFNTPFGLTLAEDGTLFVADDGNARIRRVSADGVVTTVAGTGAAGHENGTGVTGAFNRPSGLALDPTGRILYVADASGPTIRKVTPGWVVTTLAGVAAVGGWTDGPGVDAIFQHPNDVAVDLDGNVLVADWSNHRIRKITPDGVVSTFVGGGPDQCADGTGTDAGMNSPRAIAVGADGMIYVAESYGHRIRAITPEGVVTTLAGACNQAGVADGVGAAARFIYPGGIDVDQAGNLYVVGESGVLNKITPAGVVTTLATGVGAFGVAVSPSGDEVFIAQGGQVQRWTQESGVTQFVSGFSGLWGLTRATDGTLYVADDGGHRMTRVSPSGVISVIAGSGQAFDEDGVGGAASFTRPFGPDVDPSGKTVYVSEGGGHTIRKLADETLPGWLSASVSGGTGNGTVTLTALANNTGVARTATMTVAGKTITITQDALPSVLSAPRNVTAQPGNAQASVSFDPPRTNGGSAITSYTVTASPGGASTTGAASPLLVTGLINGTAYTFTVTATNGVSTSAASGPSSPVTPVSPATVPGAPTAVVGTRGNGQVSVAFTAPSSDGGSAITNYTVTTSPGGATTTGTASPIMVTGLTNGTAYTFTVTATNAVGDGAASDASSAVTPATVPGAPTAVVGTRGNGQVSVAFTAPSSDGGSAITNYTVTTSPGGATTTGTSSPIMVTGLTNGTAYTFTVTATNAVGEGAPSAASEPVLLAVEPTIVSPPSNQTVTAGSTTTFTVVATGPPTPTYRWQVSTNGGVTFVDLSDEAPYSGTTEATMTITATPVALHGARYRVVATNVAGSATSTSAALSVRGEARVAPASVRFGGLKTGPTLTSVSASQQLTINFTGASSAWSVTPSVPWLQVTGGAGTGAGSFTVQVVNPGDVIGSATSLTGSLVVSTPEAPQTSTTVSVSLSLTQVTLPPFGQVDTPTQNAAGVQGAIGVTGWALDDVGVVSVRVFRTCLGYEEGPSGSCQTILEGTPEQARVVFVGDAAFLAGARPDVEGGFSTTPQSHRGGWGMLMLTPMLPNVPESLVYGGVGPLTIYVVATDVEGNKVLLGRSSDPASPQLRTPTQITMANSTADKPFGSIDTPMLGETISGVIPNFGWALTPDLNTTAGPDDVLIPINGSTMWVFVDDLPVANVVYNQCRGTGFSPTAFCNDDVSNIFGNPTPQPVLQTRTENLTRYRNLDVGFGPIGAYVLDTRTLRNGLHTIAWSVTDSLGRVEGIGSRFFTVLNSGTVPADPETVGAEARRAWASAPPDDLRRAWALAPPDSLYGRTGFDLRAEWVEMHPRTNGRYHVQLPEVGRMELQFGAPVDSGHLVAPDGTERDLPVGSSLDGTRFGWAVPIGYHGTYHLVFVRGGERIDVDVMVAPVARTEDGAPEVRMHLDSVLSAGCAVRSGGAGCAVRLQGWAYDPRAAIESGIGTVHVWARRVQGPGSRVQGSGPFFVGEATLDVPRPDVAQAHGDAPGRAGFSLSATLAPGTYEFTAYVWNVRTARWEDARTVRGTVR